VVSSFALRICAISRGWPSWFASIFSFSIR
jgi:hypothetical protein